MRRYRSYKFTDKKHSVGGIRSSIAAAISTVCTSVGVYIAYHAKGDGGNFLALLGVVAIVSCIYGAIVGGQSFKEEECYYLFSRLGSVVNVVLVVFWVAVVGIGILM